MDTYEQKCLKLRAMLADYGKQDVLLAFSGGADSSLILKILCEVSGAKVYAVTMQTELQPIKELEGARKAAQEAGAVHLVLEVEELSDDAIRSNPENRCYLCKKYLFSRLLEQGERLKIHTFLEGTNADDLHVYRPGIRAVRELGIHSPLADCGFSKEEVRRLAQEYHIMAADKPAAPCLATRFPYGTVLSEDEMRKAEKGEAYIRTFGFYNVRLRVYGDLVRIEVDSQDICRLAEHRAEITEYLKGLGYALITADLEGFRSGSMDYKILQK